LTKKSNNVYYVVKIFARRVGGGRCVWPWQSSTQLGRPAASVCMNLWKESSSRLITLAPLKSNKRDWALCMLSSVMARNIHWDLNFSFVYSARGIPQAADRRCICSNLY